MNEEDDGLLDRLRALPPHAPTAPLGRDPHRTARAAFERAASGKAGLPNSAREVGRALALASIVGLYLSWAFSAVIALHR